MKKLNFIQNYKKSYRDINYPYRWYAWVQGKISLMSWSKCWSKISITLFFFNLMVAMQSAARNDLTWMTCVAIWRIFPFLHLINRINTNFVFIAFLQTWILQQRQKIDLLFIFGIVRVFDKNVLMFEDVFHLTTLKA